MKQPNDMFTISAEYDDKEDALTLLFAAMGPVYTQDAVDSQLREIAESELSHKVLGPNFVVATLSINGHMRILATNNPQRWAIPALADYNPVLINSMALIANSKVTYIGRRETYNGCTLPQQIIVGCNDCAKMEATVSDCIVKKFAIHNEVDHGAFTPENAYKILKNRKSSIGGFTYISPDLTQVEHFKPTFRDVGEHDFTAVAENSAIRSQAVRERTRYKRFRKEVCPTCGVKDGCGGPKDCPGPFPKTETLMINDCLDNFARYGRGFTQRQLLELAFNCGEIKKDTDRGTRRPKNRRYWATFHRDWDGKQLEFRLNSVTRSFETIDFGTDFEKAKAYLKEYNAWEELPKSIAPLSRLERALLFELTDIHISPTNTGRWQATTYYTIGLTMNPYRAYGRFNLHFVASSYRDWADDSCVCPWTISPDKYSDIWNDAGFIGHVPRETHELSYSEYHNK